jgi:hypothetical protein
MFWSTVTPGSGSGTTRSHRRLNLDKNPEDKGARVTPLLTCGICNPRCIRCVVTGRTGQLLPSHSTENPVGLRLGYRHQKVSSILTQGVFEHWPATPAACATLC